ncbi:MAG TPA: hypothetical protein VNO14_09180 [Blastocatellia bacterium]|nr:hypothetical protein [Blastocatellia bacterium]
MKRTRLILTLSAVLLAFTSTGAYGKSNQKAGSKPADKLAKATSDLVEAANEYKSSVQSLIPMYENALKSARETLEKRKELYAQGFISRRELEASEQAVKEAEARLEQARKHMTESDQLIAEAKASEELARQSVIVPARPAARGRNTAISAVMRYNGSGGWSLAQASKVQSFFASKFGRQLPISAYGQTATHNRMQFDHRNSIDVALHPDSAEGKALMAFLRSNGIPHIAFRSAVPGAATGAHIHIGYPSSRL